MEFESRHKNQKLCSRKCSGLARRGILFLKETKIKMSIAGIKRTHNIEWKREHGEKIKKWYQNPENRKKMSKAMLEAQNRPEVKLKKSKSRKTWYQNLSIEAKNKMREKHIGKKQSLETKKKNSIASKKMWQDRKYREKTIKNMKIVANTLEHKEKMRQKTKATWDNPNSIFNTQEYREKLGIISKKRWQNSEYREKMLAMNNPNYNICLECGKRFRTSHKKQICCSKKCSNINRRKQLEVKCLNCGKLFESVLSRNSKFCSRTCSVEYKIGENNSHWKGGQIEKICPNCEENFKVYPGSITVCCSKECAYEWVVKTEKLKGIPQSENHLKNRIIAMNKPEYKQKQSISSKKRWLDSEYVKKMMKANNRKPTNPEKVFDEITPVIVRYVGNRGWNRWTGKQYRNPDFKITGQNKVIEIYGDYWHRNDNPEDLIQEYKDIGLDCLVFWEHEIYDDINRVLKKVNEFVEIK